MRIWKVTVHWKEQPGSYGKDLNLGHGLAAAHAILQAPSTPSERYARSFLLALCLLQSGSYVYASDDLNAIQQSAKQGDAGAQSNLGFRYATGQGVAQDYQQAMAWYLKAADQGHAEAQYYLGIGYAHGYGVQQDFKQAVVWYRKAAEQGDAYAQMALGVMYLRGDGIPQDTSHSYLWFSVAVVNGNSKATELRELVAQKLSRVQLETMQKLAGQYFEKYQPRG